MDKTQYYTLCEAFTYSAEGYFNERLGFVYFYFSLLTRLKNRLNCTANNISVFKFMNDKYDDFTNSIANDEGHINWALNPQARDAYLFDFKLRVNKVIASNIKHNMIYDDIIVKTKIIKENNIYHFWYSDYEEPLKISDYNDDSQMNPVIDKIVTDLFNIYKNPGVKFYIGGMTIREL